MKKLGTNGVKVLKTCHLLFVMIWLVGVIAMGVVNMITPNSGDELYMALYVNRIIDDVLVIPGAMLTVVTAVIYGICTNWGFFRHKWITVKWIISLIVIITGTFYFNPIHNHLLDVANATRDAALNNPDLATEHTINLIGPFVQSAALVFLVVISVFKPWKKKRINSDATPRNMQ